MSEADVLVLGGSGLVGSRVLELWSEDPHAHLIAPAHAELDVLETNALANFLRQSRASVVLNLAAWADVDAAEAQRGDVHGRVYALNAAYPAHLARLCGELGKHLVHVSTDYVFDGNQPDRPYGETDATHPLGWYAQTKHAGERSVLESGASSSVVRIEMPFTAANYPRLDFPRLCFRRLQAGESVFGVEDQHITPVFLDDVATALRLLVAERFRGVIHVAASDWTTPYRFAGSIARRLGLDESLVQPARFDAFMANRAAPRPQHSWLDVSLFSQVFGRNILRDPEAQLEAWVSQLATVPSRV